MTAPNSGGIRLNEHVEADGPTARLQNGPGGPCVEVARLVLSQRPIPRLAQNEKPECAGSRSAHNRSSSPNHSRVGPLARNDWSLAFGSRRSTGRVDLCPRRIAS